MFPDSIKSKHPVWDISIRKPQAKHPILLHAPFFAGNEWRYTKECLDTGWVSTAGRFVGQFEEAVAGYLGMRNAVATVNGTAALHLALQAVGVGAGDEVLVSALTFVASANAISYCGASPVFMDSDLISWTMDPQKLTDFIQRECEYQNKMLRNRSTGRRIAAILPVHLLGHPADLDPILDLGLKYDLPVVEDAAQSLGAFYKNRLVGALGDIACISFNGNKIATTGGGGMVLTNRNEFAKRLRHLSSQARRDSDSYWHDTVGYNYRMPNINAALGLAQIEQLAAFVKLKRKIGNRYRLAFQQIPNISFMPEASWAQSTYWLNTILLDKHSAGVRHEYMLRELNRLEIQARSLWISLSDLPIYQDFQAYQIEVATDLYQRSISLPSSASLSKDEQKYIIDCVEAIIKSLKSI